MRPVNTQPIKPAAQELDKSSCFGGLFILSQILLEANGKAFSQDGAENRSSEHQHKDHVKQPITVVRKIIR